MSKLNPKNKNAELNGVAISYNGNPQTLKADAQQLYEIIVSTLYGKDNFYESTDVRLRRLIDACEKLVAANQMDFIANAIVHARVVMNIRTMPLVLTAVFAKIVHTSGKSYPHMRKLVCDVITRADQITDMYAVSLRIFGSKNKIPMAIKRGVGDAFNKFDAYTFAKYNRDGEVKLSDVLRITHPTPEAKEQGELFAKIINGTLESPYTWEVELSKNGQLPEAERKSKAELWTELVNSGKIGYMALIRNLRNIFEADVDKKTKEVVYSRLADPNEVQKSKQLPFRFVNAMDAVREIGDNKLARSISRAMDVSLKNIPKIGNNVWIIIDCSLSMGGGRYYSNSSSNSLPIKTAALFAAALAKANAEADNLKITMFSDDAKHINVNTDDSIMGIQNTLIKNSHGGGTNLQAALDKKKRLGFEPDTVIILSDMEVDRLNSKNATNIFTDNCVKIAINLNSNQSTPLGEKQGWYQLAGWSERLFDFIPAMRNKTSVVNTLSVPYLGHDVKYING